MGKLIALADDTNINESEIARRFDDIKAQLDDMHMFMNVSDASHAAKNGRHTEEKVGVEHFISQEIPTIKYIIVLYVDCII